MKKYFSFAIFLISLFLVQPVSANFQDVDEDTLYKEAIEWTVEEGITKGYDNGDWGPDDCVTRTQLLKMLLEYRFGDDFKTRSYGLEGLSDFSDISDQDWHYDYVRFGQFLDIVQGYSDGNFRPDICVNRVEAMKMAVSTLMPGEQVVSSLPLSYWRNGPIMVDMDPLAWYAPYARVLFNSGLAPSDHTQVAEVENFDPSYYTQLLGGLDANKRPLNFFPADDMSRKEVAEMLFRIYKSKVPYSKVTYKLSEEAKGFKALDQQSLIRINQDQTEEVLIEDMLEKYRAKFEHLVAFDSMIRGKIKGSDELILEARNYENDFLSSKLYRLNVNTLELQEFKISQNLNQLFYYRLSPDGNKLIWISTNQLPIMSFENPNPYRPDATMYLVDLMNDTYQSIVQLTDEEIFHRRDQNLIMLKSEWLDNQRIKYSVHQITEDRSDPLLGYRTVIIDEPLESHYLSSISQDYLPYFYIEPSNVSDYEGIFIYMHGAGGGYEQGMSDDNYAGNFGNLKQVLKDMNFVYVTPETNSFGESGGVELVDFMSHLKQEYGDLPIYISGASAGGGTIFHTLNKVTSTINLKGAVFVVPSISQPLIDTFDPTLTNLKFWIEAGELDGVFPPDRVEVFEQHLLEKGYEVESNVIPEGDHNAPVEQIDWQGVLDYLAN